MHRMVSTALGAICGLLAALAMTNVGLWLLAESGARPLLGEAAYPLLASGALVTVRRLLGTYRTDEGSETLMACLVAMGLLIGWLMVDGGSGSLWVIWARECVAFVIALAALEARLQFVAFDANGERQIGIDEAEVMLVVLAVTLLAVALAGYSARGAVAVSRHGPVGFRDVFGEALAWLNLLLLVGFAALLLREGMRGGEISRFDQWGTSWLASDDPLLRLNWRVIVTALLCGGAAHVVLLIDTSTTIGPWTMALTGLLLGAGAASGFQRTARRASGVVLDVGERVQSDAIGVALIGLLGCSFFAAAVLLSLTRFDAATVFCMGASLLCWLVALLLGRQHTDGEIRDWLLELIWFALAMPVAVLWLAFSKTPQRWVLLGTGLVASAVVLRCMWSTEAMKRRLPAGLVEYLRNWREWARTGGGGDDTSIGGRMRDGDAGDELRHK